MDVDEFIISFLDQLQKELKLENEDFLSRFFFGKLH